MEDDTYERLLAHLRKTRAAAVGFSGGTDSTFLLAAANAALGGRVLALTAVTPYMERQEVADALATSARLGVRHELVELDMPAAMASNPPHRCYICKRALYGKLLRVAQEAGFGQVLDGSNLDDLGDYRPGLRALRELWIQCPLIACKIPKAEVRRMSEALGLPTWNRATNACLLTRLPIGQRVSMEILQRVEEAERFLRARGYSWVRVRMHGELARIEVAPEQRAELLEEAEEVSEALRTLGFRHVSLDLLGYRLGSMNPVAWDAERPCLDKGVDNPVDDPVETGADNPIDTVVATGADLAARSRTGGAPDRRAAGTGPTGRPWAKVVSS